MTEDNIRRLLDLVGVLRVKADKGNVNCACPFAPFLHARGTDRKPSFGVQISPTGPSQFNCLACGIRGRSVADLVEKLQRFRLLGDFSATDPELADSVNQEVFVGFLLTMDWVDKSFAAKDEEERVEQETVWPEENVEGFESYCEYIASRGISEVTAAAWGVLYDPDEDRILFPIRNRKGQLVGVSTRGIETGEKLNALSYNRAEYLYGEHLYQDIPQVVIVEGQFDAMTVHQAGYPAYALLGNMMTEQQALSLRDQGIRRVVLLLDGDDGGRRGDAQIYKLLEEIFFITTTCVRLPEGTDPNSVGSSKLAKKLPYLKIPPLDQKVSV